MANGPDNAMTGSDVPAEPIADVDMAEAGENRENSAAEAAPAAEQADADPLAAAASNGDEPRVTDGAGVPGEDGVVAAEEREKDDPLFFDLRKMTHEQLLVRKCAIRPIFFMYTCVVEQTADFPTRILQEAASVTHVRDIGATMMLNPDDDIRKEPLPPPPEDRPPASIRKASPQALQPPQVCKLLRCLRDWHSCRVNYLYARG